MEDIGHLVKNQFARNRNNIGRVRRRDGFQGFACVIFSVMKRREGGRKRNHKEEGRRSGLNSHPSPSFSSSK